MSSRWPGMLKRKTAAEYLDMSEAAFEREVSAGRIPQPVTLGNRPHWRKDAIDAALARLTGDGDGAEPDYIRETRERYGKAA